MIFDFITLQHFAQGLEIFILAMAYYYLLFFLRGTRGAQVLSGFTAVLILLFVVTRFLNLDSLNWILKQFSPYIAVAFIIIFHPEIRRALAQLGKQNVFSSSENQKSLVEPLVSAVSQLSDRKIGALIAIEREIGTRTLEETGTLIDSAVSPELICNIFFPRSPLHDGGVIIRGKRIVAAGCVFPLTQRDELSKALGTRHRAAIGISEETDAVVIVVSEETGTISLAYNGRISRGLEDERLRRLLSSLLNRETKKKKQQISEQASFTVLFQELDKE